MTLRQQIKNLKEANRILRFENLRMRLELEILVDGMTSLAARKIIAKYRRKRDIRNDALLELQN